MRPTLEPLDPRALPSVPIGALASVVVDPPPVQTQPAVSVDSLFTPAPVSPAEEAAVLISTIP